MPSPNYSITGIAHWPTLSVQVITSKKMPPHSQAIRPAIRGGFCKARAASTPGPSGKFGPVALRMLSAPGSRGCGLTCDEALRARLVWPTLSF